MAGSSMQIGLGAGALFVDDAALREAVDAQILRSKSK